MLINVMLDEGAVMPAKAHKEDAGFDIFAPDMVILRGNDSVIVDTGVHMEIPEGYVGFLKSKSGLNVLHGITGEGVIDAGYTGSIVAKLNNDTCKIHRFNKGDKLIQIVILPIPEVELQLVDSFKETARGNGGFGSTGR